MIGLFNLFKPKEEKRGYFTHKKGNKHFLCKVLNEYEDEEKAENDLIYLITNRITERDLYKDFLKKKSW